MQNVEEGGVKDAAYQYMKNPGQGGFRATYYIFGKLHLI